MAKKTTTAEPIAEQAADEEAGTLRRCIGSARYGIQPHEAPVEDFPRQPSQKDGLGRMCKTHWRQYTAGLARDAQARKTAVETEPPASEDAPTAGEAPKRNRKRQVVLVPTPSGAGDAG